MPAAREGCSQSGLGSENAMTRGNAFPTTQLTWLQTHVGTGETAAARAESANKARQFVMERYAEPLAVFVRGSSLGRVSETSEIVNGFFAARLSDGAFLEAWSSSGMRLRRWLMNGILFYGQGLIRDNARSATRSTSVDPRELDRRVALNSFGEIDFEKAWALTVVREATARAEEQLRREGRGDDYEIFRRHAIEGQPYAMLAAELKKSAQQCASATRLVAQRVRAHLATLLREEGVAEAEIEDEIRSVRELIG